MLASLLSQARTFRERERASKYLCFSKVSKIKLSVHKYAPTFLEATGTTIRLIRCGKCMNTCKSLRNFCKYGEVYECCLQLQRVESN